MFKQCLHAFVISTKFMNIMWASTRENLSSGVASNKGADQPGHPHSLISAFVFSPFWKVSYPSLLQAKFQLSS